MGGRLAADGRISRRVYTVADLVCRSTKLLPPHLPTTTPEIDSLIAREVERILDSAHVEVTARQRGRSRLHGKRV